MNLDVQWLGRLEYNEALRYQEELVKQRQTGAIGDTLLLLEHEPVYTIGRTQDRTSLGEIPDNLPHPWVVVGRGGQATYHGPGQLVGYPIIDLKQYGQDLHAYLRALEHSIVDLALALNISQATRRKGLTGVWVGERKLASIGVGVRRWISMHGFALNVTGDLGPFYAIIPCGIGGVTMTSLTLESEGRKFTVEDTAERYVPFLAQRLQAIASGNDVSPSITFNAPKRV